MRTGLILALGAALAASPASANWQYTKWGMKPDEAVAASNGQLALKPNPDRMRAGNVRAVTGSYSAADVTFEAMLDFDPSSNGLAAVVLRVSDPLKCSGVRDSLYAKYGEPSVKYGTVSDGRILWRDPKAGNSIEFTSISIGIKVCAIAYGSLDAATNGL